MVFWSMRGILQLWICAHEDIINEKNKWSFNLIEKNSNYWGSERFFSPSVLIHNLSLLLRSEIVFNVEVLPDFWNGHALDDTSNFGAAQFKEWLDVKEVCSENHLEKQLLLNVDEVGIPLIYDIWKLVRAERFVNLGSRIYFNLLEVLNDLLKNCLVYLW